MRAVTVYRVDYDRKTKDPIGTVLEKRKTERRYNYHDLLRLARRLFALDKADVAPVPPSPSTWKKHASAIY